MKEYSIGVFAGSLRKESISKKTALCLIALAPQGFKFELVETGYLPFYNQDWDDFNQVPKEVAEFREKIKNFDGYLFSTPEYNRSVPALLKNAIDLASRPHVKNCWNGKPGAIISVSTGAISGFGANHHLRQILTFVNVYTMQQPEAYLGFLKSDGFTDDHKFKNESTQKFVEKFVAAYVEWFHRLVRQ